MQHPADAPLAEQEQPQERRLREEGEHALQESVWPTTGPAKCENLAQFVPNWNSIGIPVTTPVAKVTAKMRAQNRAAWPYCGSLVLSSTVLSTAINTPSPIVRTGKR